MLKGFVYQMNPAEISNKTNNNKNDDENCLNNLNENQLISFSTINNNNNNINQNTNENINIQISNLFTEININFEALLNKIEIL